MAPALLASSRVGGILGKLSFDRDETLARPVLEQILSALQHGFHAPSALHVAPGIALGWCSGSEEAAAGRQSVIANEFQTVRVVADSALTNARALGATLERRGFRIRTRRDAELMAHAYDAWGERCVEAFDGPFACAIWDARRGRLLLARDHLGIRPLYFALLPGRGVVFASEAAALLQDPGVGRECCAEAIDAYLALGYVPAPLTAYRRVSKLEPAHRLIVEGRRLHAEQYWDLPGVSDDRRPDAAAALAEELERAALDDADDGAAVLYSGGLASSALLATTPPGRGRAVSVALGCEGDEFGDARTRDAARRLGHEPVLEPMAPDAPLDATVRLTGALDEPIADPAAVVQYVLCGAAGRYASAVRSGHGAAALWAGYTRHRADRVDAIVRGWLGRGLGPVGHLAGPLRASLRDRPPAVGPGTGPSDLWDDRTRPALYTREFAAQVCDVNPFARHMELYAARASDDPVDRALYVDARTFLPDSALAVAARSADAVGLACRFPYLRRDLVALAATMPPADKGPGGGMRPLRDLLARRLPPSLLPPPRRPAAHRWLHRTLATLVPAVLLGDRFDGRGIVSPAGVRQVWDEHCDGRGDHARRLWSLLVLELWFQQVLDGQAAEEPLGVYAPLRAA